MPDERRVLLIEDDEDGREALTQFLQTWGFGVDAVADADGALEVLLHGHPDVIVTDLMLTDGEPGDLIHRMRVLAGESVFIVAYSGWNCHAAAALAAGANAFILKPDVDGLERLLLGPEVGAEAKRRPKI